MSLDGWLAEEDRYGMFHHHHVEVVDVAEPVCVATGKEGTLHVTLSDILVQLGETHVRDIFSRLYMRGRTGADIPRLGEDTVSALLDGKFTAALRCTMRDGRPLDEPEIHVDRPSRIPGFAEAVGVLADRWGDFDGLSVGWRPHHSPPSVECPYTVYPAHRFIELDPFLGYDGIASPRLNTYVVLSALADYLSWDFGYCRVDREKRDALMGRLGDRPLLESIIKAGGWRI